MAPPAILAEVMVKLDLVTFVLLPVRQIEPPLDEPVELMPLLFIHVILYINPSLPSQLIAPPSSPAMLSMKVELYSLQPSPVTNSAPPSSSA